MQGAKLRKSDEEITAKVGLKDVGRQENRDQCNRNESRG